MNQPFISLPVASEVMPSISEIYTGGKNVEKKSICLSLSTRPSNGNFRLTSRFGSMGWMINANVSTDYHDSNSRSPGRGYSRRCRLADLNL